MQNNQIDTPEKMLDLIKRGMEVLQKHGSIMTQFEKLTAQEEIQAAKDKYHPYIVQHVLGKHNQAIENYKEARALVAKAKANETNRWDPAKLRDNMQLIGDQIARLSAMQPDPLRGFDPVNEVKALFDQAKNSQDPYKQRAAAEIIATMPEFGNHDTAVELAILKHDARNVLSAVHETEEIAAAKANRDAALQELAKVQTEVIETGNLMGYDTTGVFSSGPYAQALKRVNFQQDGVEILEPDDPRVTGIAKFEIPKE